MIYANVNLEIKDDIAKADRNIILYKGDKNVELRFIMHDNRFIVLNSTYAQLLIKRPSASPIFSEVAQIDGDTVVFLITKDMIDELQELGAYSFQIRLFDDNMEGRVTLPPCEECLIIREPLAEEVARVNDGMVNYSLLGHGEDYSDIFDETGDYIKTEWKDGDIITDDRLNKVEQALYGLTEGCARLSSYETTLMTIPKEVLQEALDNGVTTIEWDSFTLDPTDVVYAEFGGTEMASTVVDPGYFEFFVATPTMDSGFAVVAYDGQDLVGANPSKSKIMLRVIKDLPITDLRFFQRDVNTISSIYLEHDMNVINSFSMNRRGAIGQFSTVLGGSCLATGQYSVATGLASSATGAMAVALGRGCSATGTAGFATGQMCISGQEGLASGRQSQATGRASSSLGNYCMAKGTYSMAHGDNCQTTGSTSHAEGYYTIAGSAYQHVEGKYNISDTKSTYAHIIGNGTSNTARSNAHTLDWKGNAWFAGDITVGADKNKVVTENNALLKVEQELTMEEAEQVRANIKTIGRDMTGVEQTPYTIEETSEGLVRHYGDPVIGKAHSETYNDTDNIATGTYSAARGYMCQATGEYSYASGWGSIASGLCSRATGLLAQATGPYATCEGTRCQATKNNAHAEGDTCIASGNNAHAEGYQTQATTNQAHSEGGMTVASGVYSHAEGEYAKASGRGAHAEGFHTLASGRNAFAAGEYVTSSGRGQFCIGKYNTANTTDLFIIGCGTADTTAGRMNAHTVNANGVAWYRGDVYVGGTKQSEGNKLLSTADIYFDTDGNLVVSVGGVTKKFAPIE